MTIAAEGCLLLKMLLKPAHQNHNRNHLEEFFLPLLPLLLHLIKGELPMLQLYFHRHPDINTQH